MIFEQSLKCRCVSHAARQLTASSATDSRFFISEAKPHHAPNRFVKIDHIKLEIRVDLQSKLLSGVCTTTFKTAASEVTQLVFDAVDLVVESVVDASDSPLMFDQSNDKLNIVLSRTFKKGETGEVRVRYHVQEPRAGLYFIAPDTDHPERPWQLWTQGEDEDNRYWFPCHDSPHEKATTEMIVTVDQKYTAISNGRLISRTVNSQSREVTYHWKQAIPHSSYLVTLCVGEFVETSDSWKNSKGELIPVVYYSLAGREEETKVSFGKTPEMIEFFSRSIGVDYPYEKYAQIVAWDFIYGGMENTSATTQTEYTLHPASLEQDYSSEPLVAHELAHQWFGDLLTCKEWRHAWLNEGFATYFETLWTHHAHGKEEALYELYQNEGIYKEEDGGAYRRPIVTNVYISPSDIFDRHLYEKGGRVLHMLHLLVGDAVWWQAIRSYVERHRSQNVETIDLQRVFEECSGRSLGWFFDQWVFKAGHPELKVSASHVAEKSQIKISISQTQKQNELTPLFQFPLRIKVCEKGVEKTITFEIKEKDHTFWIPCDQKPDFVSINCENTVLGEWKIETDTAWQINQLSKDQDVMGRIQAAKTLSKNHSRKVLEALGSALESEKFWGAQVEIAAALSKNPSPRALELLEQALQNTKHPKARKAIIQALGEYRSESQIEKLVKILKTDSSPIVQGAAAQAIGKTQSPKAFSVLAAEFLNKKTWHDARDAGIVAGLSLLKREEGVATLLIKALEPVQSMFLRRAAVDGLARWASAHPSKVLDIILPLLRDKNYFVKTYAIHALESLGDDRAMGALRRLADSSVEPRTHRAAIVASKSLRDGRTALEEAEKLKSELDRLRQEYSDVLSRLEKLERHSEVQTGKSNE